MKALLWIIGHWKLLAGIAAAALIAFGGIQSCRADKAEREQLRLEGKLEEQMADHDALWDKMQAEREGRAEAEAAEKKKRKNLEARIQKFQRDRVIAKRALAAEKKKTAKLPPTELVAQINERIGDESSLTAGGLFLFSRVGANRTLDRFKDGEFHLSEYIKFQKVIEDHEAEVNSFNTSISECEEEKEENLKGWTECKETLQTALNDIAVLKKIKKSKIWKGRLEGGIFVIIIVGGTKLFGIW